MRSGPVNGLCNDTPTKILSQILWWELWGGYLTLRPMVYKVNANQRIGAPGNLSAVCNPRYRASHAAARPPQGWQRAPATGWHVCTLQGACFWLCCCLHCWTIVTDVSRRIPVYSSKSDHRPVFLPVICQRDCITGHLNELYTLLWQYILNRCMFLLYCTE